MWAYAIATWRQGYRSPFTWVLAAIAVFAGWFGTTAAILALRDVGDQGVPIILSTGHLAGVFLAIWLIGRSLEEDRHAGFAAAADAAAPGHAGRLLGRWVGATAAGTALAVLVAYVTATSSALPWPDALLLLSTSIQTTALAGAWGLLLGTLWRSGGAMVLVLLLWVLGHLPWGTAPFLEGTIGRVVGAWLPGPRLADSGAEALGYTSAAVAGILLGALALSRPSES
jgi:hypothetical protein